MIHEIIDSNYRTMSFEVYPPRDEKRTETLVKILDISDEVYKLGPKNTFMTVTHRVGTTFDNTVEACKIIKLKHPDLPVVAHMTTIGCTEEELDRRVEKLKDANVDAVLALTGDFPDGYDRDSATYPRAINLIEALSKRGIEVGGSWYPNEKSPYKLVCTKREAGASFFIGQMIFDRITYIPFMKETSGVTYGFLPIFTQRMYELNKDTVPMRIIQREGFESPEFTRDFGIAVFDSLLLRSFDKENGHAHVYTMDSLPFVKEVINKYKGIIG